MADYTSFDASQFDLLTSNQPQDDYLSKLLSFDTNGGMQPFPAAYTTQGASSPENSSASASASPESSTAHQAAPQLPSTALRKASNTTTTATSTNNTIHHDKRKKNNNSDQTGALKDRRASNSHTTEHTHNLDDEDGTAELDEHGKPIKGGKTSERRKLQNRQAQRNFRERKEKHLKELEERVQSLEQQSNDQASENSALKQLLERLQSENERLKVFESAFSFNYADDVSGSSAMPTSDQFKPPTPPTAQDEISDLSSFTSSLNSFSSQQPSRETSISSAGNSPGAVNGTSQSLGQSGFTTSASLFGASPSAFGLPSQMSPVATNTTSPGAFVTSPTAFDDSMFLSALSSSSSAGASPSSLHASSIPSPAASGSGSGNMFDTATNMNDLFSAYRDPNFGVSTLQSLNDFDSLFGSSAFGGGPSPLPPTNTSVRVHVRVDHDYAAERQRNVAVSLWPPAQQGWQVRFRPRWSVLRDETQGNVSRSCPGSSHVGYEGRRRQRRGRLSRQDLISAAIILVLFRSFSAHCHSPSPTSRTADIARLSQNTDSVAHSHPLFLLSSLPPPRRSDPHTLTHARPPQLTSHASWMQRKPLSLSPLPDFTFPLYSLSLTLSICLHFASSPDSSSIRTRARARAHSVNVDVDLSLLFPNVFPPRSLGLSRSVCSSLFSLSPSLWETFTVVQLCLVFSTSKAVPFNS